jgi:hypothetical protein
MSQLVPITAPSDFPALIAASGEKASYRFLEFFSTQIRNPHTRPCRSVVVFDRQIDDNDADNHCGDSPTITAATSVCRCGRRVTRIWSFAGSAS